MRIDRDFIDAGFVLQDKSGVTWNKEEFLKKIKQWHTVFRDRKLEVGDRVAFNASQSIDLFALMIASFEYGLTCVVIPMSSYFVDDAAQFDYRPLNIKVVFEGDAPVCCNWNVPIVSMGVLQGVQPFEDYAPIDVDLPILLTQTSGTTGKPRVLMHSHRSLFAASSRARKHFYTEGDRVLLYSTMNHVGVLSVQTLPVMSLPLTAILYDDFATLDLAIARTRPNKTILFPGTIEKMPDHTPLDGMEIISGGGILLPEFLEHLFSRGVVCVLNVYGLSEAMPPISYSINTPAGWRRNYFKGRVCIGTLLEGWEMQISDSGFMVKGDGVAFGDDLERTKVDCWVPTGDSISQTADGRLWIGERKYQMLRLPDGTLYPDDVLKQVIREDSRVSRVKLAVLQDKLVAFLALTDASLQVTAEELTERLKGRTYHPIAIDRVITSDYLMDNDQIKHVLRPSRKAS